MARTSSGRILKFPPLSATAKFSEYDSLSQREMRWEAALPLRLTVRLTGEADEMIPGQLLNLSASGLLVLVDERFSLLLPPPPGTRFEVEFFVDDLEIRQVTVEVRRVEKRDPYQFALGCVFVDLPKEARLSLRGEIGARLAAKRRQK